MTWTTAGFVPPPAGGDNGRRIRMFDWARTPLGDIATWPAHLRTAVDIVLGSRFPMTILWGPQRIQLYNDGYIPIFGSKHPASLGRPAHESWAEIWDIVDPMFSAVEQTGQPTWCENQLLLLERLGRREERYFTFSYSPIRSADGGVDGVFVTALETTAQVLAERRERTLREMAQAVRISPAAPTIDAIERALGRCAAPLADDPNDVPFALVYLREPGAMCARLVATHGVDGTAICAEPVVSLSGRSTGAEGWPIAAVFHGGRPQRVRVPGSADPHAEAMIVPLRPGGEGPVTALLVAGLSPARPIDANYEQFVLAAAEQLGLAIGSAHAYDKLVNERIALLERMEDGFFALDPAWRVTYANAQAIHYVRRPRDEILGRVLWDVDPELIGSETQQHFHAAMREQAPVHFETQSVENERHFLVHAYPSPEGLTVFFRDLTRLQEAEARLRSADELNSTLVRDSPIAIVTTDREMRVTGWNPAAERLFGWREDEVLGRELPPALAGDGRVDGVAVVEAAEVRLRRRDGTTIDALLSSSLLRDEAGRVTGRVCFVVDQTDRKLLEEQFRQAQKMEAIGRLAGGIAHDFNNLLAVIWANLDLYLAPADAGGAQLDCLRDASHATARAVELTRRLLTFSRRQPLELQPVDLDRVIAEDERIVRRLIPSNIELQCRLGAGGGRIRADPAQLEQVLVNLVVNARDAMRDGGRLTIETSRVQLPQPAGGAPAGAYVRLEVRDDGRGMDTETQQRVFEPFFTTKPVGEGTGLGLATVYGIVRQLGGFIGVTSAPGEGATFTLLFPEDRSEEEATPASPPGPTPRPPDGDGDGRGAVLVVEDERYVRSTVRRILERDGYDVLEAGDGVEALETFDRHGERIGLVLSDLVMPRMGGRELCRRLKERAPGLHVLFMSGYDRDPEEGAEVDIAKPFDPATLLACVRARLPGVQQPA